MAAVVACLVGCLLVLRPRLSVWHFVPAGVAAVVLGVGQLVSAAHWPSDLLGGALLALVVVGATRPVDPGRDRVAQGDGAALQHSDGVPQRTPR